jgi:UDP-N-acetyl-D-mannosaminuronic acid dehydrogenase
MSAHSRIVVLGLGDIGLPTAAVLARAGCRVTVVDTKGLCR